LGVETQDPRDPEGMIKGAAMHASGQFGYQPLYGGYNPGYSKTDPIVEQAGGGGGLVNARMNPQVLKRAEKVLGKDAVANLMGGGADVGATTQPRPGPWGGSQSVIKELLGKQYAKKADWKDKEDRGGSGSFHDVTNENSFAADIAIDEAGLSTEKLVDRIAKKVGLNPKDVNYGTRGLESGINYKGYDIQFLPYDHGSGPHVHIGATWRGGGVPSSGTPGALGSGVGAAGSSLSSSAGSTPPSDKPNQKRRSERVSRRLRAIDARMTTTLTNLPEAEKRQVREITANLEPEDVQRIIAALT
jgi:hypothetical protein